VRRGEAVRQVYHPSDREIEPAGDDDDALPDRCEDERHRRVHDRRPLEVAGKPRQLAIEEADVERGHSGEHDQGKEERRRLDREVLEAAAAAVVLGLRDARHAASSRSEAATIASASVEAPSSSAATRPSRMTSTRWQSRAISSVSLE